MKFSVVLLIISWEAFSQDTIIVYNRNMSNEFVNESVQNAALLSTPKFGEYELIASSDMEQGDAFQALLKGDIDIFVGASTSAREKLAPLVYVPLDRGLLGFRLCLVHKDTAKLKSIENVAQFVGKQLSVGLGETWPDRIVFEENGFTTITSTVFSELFTMLDQRKFDCFTRSVNEISYDLADYQHLNIEIDQKLVMIYPNTDFIFVNPNKPALLKRFSYGMQEAISNNSYYELFDKHFKYLLEEHKIYERKLIFLNSTKMSEKTLKAINRYGIASFVIQ